jgi:hypothetical protein
MVKGTWGEKIWSALGGGGIDKSNVSAHPEFKPKYKNPKPRRADDERSTVRKLGDEFAGKTVGGNEVRFIDRSTGDVPKGPKGPKGPSTSVVAKPKRTVVKAGKTTAPAAAAAPSKRVMKSDRMDSAGYTTSAPNKNWSGFTYGSKSSAKPKVAAAKKTKVGRSHNPKGLNWFNGKG